MIRKFLRRLRKIRGRLFVDLGDYRHTVVLAGTGRSGTTWVGDIINYNNSYRAMFEPFNSRKIGILSEWNYRQYLRADKLDNKFLKPATDILNGNIRHGWIDNLNRKVIAKKRLVKDIHANLLLRWIKQNVPAIPIVLLLRHPCAVANSRLKLGWGNHLDDFLIQKELLDDFLNPFKKQIESAVDSFDKQIFFWCIENYVPLKQFSEGEIHVIFYEKLCTSPQQEIEELLMFVGEPLSPRVFNMLQKPSALSRKDSAIRSGSNLIDSWRKDITNAQAARAIEILSLFGLQAIYGESSLPLLSGRDALNLFSQ